MDSLKFLKSTAPIGPLYVLHGDEAFLKRQVLTALRARALGPAVDEQVLTTFNGDNADFATVIDELHAAPFFAPRRMVVVEGADPFVSKFRASWEKHIGNLPPTGILVLDVKSWTSTTRLAKLVPDAATIVCKAPRTNDIASWCIEWATSRHQKQLTWAAAALLVEFVGPEMGLLDQEILKLAIYVGERKKIDPADVDRLVGNNRAESTWKIFDALAKSNAGEALAILDRALEQGEDAHKIMGAFSMQLRRLAQAARLSIGGLSLREALGQVGVRGFAIEGAEKQLRHLTRARVLKVYDWLLDMNMDLRGGSPLPQRTLLERFLLRLARPS